MGGFHTWGSFPYLTPEAYALWGAMPLYGEASLPQVASVAQVAPDTVKLVFTKAMMNDADLVSTANYNFTGPSAFTTTLITRLNATEINIQFTGSPVDFGLYTVTVTGNVKDLDSVTIDLTHNTGSFTYDVAPQVSSVSQTMLNTLTLIFSKDMSNDLALVDTGNYTFSGPSTLTSSLITRSDATTVVVTFTGIVNIGTFTITVAAAVTSLAGTAMDPAHDSADFAEVAGPSYSSGTITSGNRGELLMLQIQTCISLYPSAGVSAWTHTDIGANERVFHSVGDKDLVSGAGDTDIWLYLNFTHAASWTMTINAARDYSPTSGAWANAYAKNFAADVTWASSVTDVADISWWCVVTEYEIYVRFLQGATYRHFYIGRLTRPYTKNMNGVARATAQVVGMGPGVPITIPVDRDVSRKIMPGQYVWLVNQTPDGVAIQNVDHNICLVNSRTTTSITVASVTNTYAAGSLVGFDPAPVCARGSTSGPNFNSLLDGTGAGACIGTTVSHTMETYQTLIDPDISGTYWVFDVGVTMDSAPRGYRGKFGIIRMAPATGMVDGDIIRLHGDNADRWVAFTSVTYVGLWATIVGPGA